MVRAAAILFPSVWFTMPGPSFPIVPATSLSNMSVFFCEKKKSSASANFVSKQKACLTRYRQDSAAVESMWREHPLVAHLDPATSYLSNLLSLCAPSFLD
jgi:hypothetical protein